MRGNNNLDQCFQSIENQQPTCMYCGIATYLVIDDFSVCKSCAEEIEIGLINNQCYIVSLWPWEKKKEIK